MIRPFQFIGFNTSSKGYKQLNKSQNINILQDINISQDINILQDINITEHKNITGHRHVTGHKHITGHNHSLLVFATEQKYSHHNIGAYVFLKGKLVFRR